MAEMSQGPEGSFTQANEADLGAVYEAGFHVVPTLSEAEATSVLGRVREALEKGGGSILAEGAPKRITFSYRIERSIAGKREKYTEGYFTWIKFEASSQIIPALEDMLRSDREIIRFLLIHTVREVPTFAPRAVFASDRLEGETIQKKTTQEKGTGQVSEEELEKSLEALVQ
ncbi:MAG: 30S ribosomal protein S6 [Patescibacteria group bacterium]|nr:30S ribosomal protein S6 [Patescibacteria group bacterium]